MLSHHANARPSRNELAGIGNAVGQLVIEKRGFARVRFPIPEIRSSLRGAVMAVWPLDCGRAFAFRGCLLVMSGKSSVSGKSQADRDRQLRGRQEQLRKPPEAGLNSDLNEAARGARRTLRVPYEKRGVIVEAANARECTRIRDCGRRVATALWTGGS